MSELENGPSDDQQMINVIKGNFLFSTDSSENGNKRDSYCELHRDTGFLNIFTLAKSPLLILQGILEVTRHQHDREYFCLKYGENFNIFLTITDQSDADEWEEALCCIAKQSVPDRLRRSGTDRKRNRNRNQTLSGPSSTGFNKVTVDIDLSDDPNVSTMRGEEGEEKEISATSPREPQESHLGAVIGYDKVSPSPGSSPSNRHSYNDEGKAQTNVILEGVKMELNRRDDDPSMEEQPPTAIGFLHSWEPPSISISEPVSTIDELRSTEAVHQCTHVEIECSQEKVHVSVNKEDLLSTDNEISDIFALYKGSIYIKSCSERLQHELFFGTRIVLINNQEPLDVLRAIDYIVTSAGKTVNLLVQLFPHGVRVKLRVSSLAALGIELDGNQITDMRGDGVMSKLADGLRGVLPALSTPTEEQRTITAIGNRHVPYDATTEKVKCMLNAEINKGSGHLVLQLHPSKFCHALEDNGALLNPRPPRRPSLARGLNSNPPS